MAAQAGRVMRRTPLQSSGKPMAAGGLPAVNKREQALHRKLREDIGCAVCLFVLRIEGSRSEIHHLLSGGNRISQRHVIPLCPSHHRGVDAETCAKIEPGFTYRHSDRGADGGLAAFEQAYGSEYDLLERCEQWINDYYVTGEQDDDEAPQLDGGNTDTDADDQSDDGDARQEVERLQAFDSPVHICVTHHRARLCDPDNLNAKGVIDAIVEAGILEDDSASHVQSITHEQVKVKGYADEKTVITLTEVTA